MLIGSVFYPTTPGVDGTFPKYSTAAALLPRVTSQSRPAFRTVELSCRRRPRLQIEGIGSRLTASSLPRTRAHGKLTRTCRRHKDPSKFFSRSSVIHPFELLLSDVTMAVHKNELVLQEKKKKKPPTNE